MDRPSAKNEYSTIKWNTFFFKDWITTLKKTDLMVIIFLGKIAESSFFMRMIFPIHWNFSEFIKKIGCFTPGKISSSRGNIQVSSATPHLGSNNDARMIILFINHFVQTTCCYKHATVISLPSDCDLASLICSWKIMLKKIMFSLNYSPDDYLECMIRFQVACQYVWKCI